MSSEKVDSASKIIGGLRKAEVIPDVLKEFIPTVTVHAHFPSGHKFDQGNTLKAKDTQERPSVTIKAHSGDVKGPYTIVLTDPDAPSNGNPKWSEFCHWVHSGIKGEDGAEIDFTKGFDLIEYMGPAPPEKTGKHRYVLCVFEGKEARQGPSDRKQWGTDKVRGQAWNWASENGLNIVGANFFYCQNETQ